MHAVGQWLYARLRRCAIDVLALGSLAVGVALLVVSCSGLWLVLLRSLLLRSSLFALRSHALAVALVPLSLCGWVVHVLDEVVHVLDEQGDRVCLAKWNEEIRDILVEARPERKVIFHSLSHASHQVLHKQANLTLDPQPLTPHPQT